MNDRFRFRVWNKEDKILHYGAENAYDDMRGDPIIFANCFGELLDNDNYIVEQCTGLKDKNGNLIYEGDVIETEQFVFLVGTQKVKYIVKFGEYYQDGSDGEYVPTRCLGFYADNGRNKYDSTTSIQSLIDDDVPIEIIGNIHEQKDQQ